LYVLALPHLFPKADTAARTKAVPCCAVENRLLHEYSNRMTLQTNTNSAKLPVTSSRRYHMMPRMLLFSMAMATGMFSSR
jgi:hypothetical protein